MSLFYLSPDDLKARRGDVTVTPGASWLCVHPGRHQYRVVYVHEVANGVASVNLDKDVHPRERWDNSHGPNTVPTDSLIPIADEYGARGVAVWADEPGDVYGRRVSAGDTVVYTRTLGESCDVYGPDGYLGTVDDLPDQAVLLDGRFDPREPAPNALGTSSLDYPPGYVREADRETFVPDVIERSEVERVIRDYAASKGYERYGEELIRLLPQPENGSERRTLSLTIEWHPGNESDPVGWDWQNMVDSEGLRGEVVEVAALDS